MPSINLKHRASIHNAEAASFSLHRMHMESYADAISALLECFEDVSEERYQLRQELQEVCNAIGSTEYMDPPDGGSVTIAEQVSRMREDRNQLRAHVMLLREFVKLLRDYIPASEVGSMIVQEALTATDPKLQQSRSFTDPVTDDDFLHMVDESNFAQERE